MITFNDYLVYEDDKEVPFPLAAWYVPTFENGGAYFVGAGKDDDLQGRVKTLKAQIEDELRPQVRRDLSALYKEVIREQSVTSIESYIQQRRIVGRLTAKLSYLLICPLLEGKHKELGEFMEQVGEVGCLIDSVIDLNWDRRLGLLSFKPTGRDFVRLVLCTFRDGAALSLHYPRLFGLFVQAIDDNIQDLFRRTTSASEHHVVSERKDVATSVA